MKNGLFIASMGLGYAVLSTLAFAPFHYPLLAWVALCPLIAGAVRFRDSVKSLVLLGLVSAAFLSLTAFHWIIPSTERVTGGSAWMGAGALVLFALTVSIREILFVVLVGLLAREKSQAYLPFHWLSVAAVGTLVDGIVPKVIPVTWGNLIGDNAYLVQLVEYTGLLGLTFLLVAGNFLVYRGAVELREAHRAQRALLPSLSAFSNGGLLLLLGALAVGAVRLSEVRELQAELPTVRIATIQPASLLVDRRNLETSRDAVYTLVGDTIPGLIREAGRAGSYKLDLIVLPEAAIPFASTNPNALTLKWQLYAPPVVDMINAMASEQGASIFVTEPSIAQGTGKPWHANGVPQNTAALISFAQRRGDAYAKNILFPVGEVVPFAQSLEAVGLLDRLPNDVLTAQYLPGTQQNLISYELPKKDLPGGGFLPLICFEGIFPEYVRAFFRARAKPDFIVNVTQDGWFDDSIALNQHFELARIRAVETRRALVRAANTGFSAVIGLDGQPLAPLAGPRIASGRPPSYQVFDVPVERGSDTFYVRHGSGWTLWLALAALLVSAGVHAFGRRRSNA